MIKIFRKKIVELEAVKFECTVECITFLQSWMGESFGDVRKERHPTALGELTVKTLEDGNIIRISHVATEGDYIVKGIEGEFYPVKPAIFANLYDEVL